MRNQNVAAKECDEIEDVDKEKDFKISETTTTASGNVRIKVSTWLSGLVDEIRRKRPSTNRKYSYKGNLSTNDATGKSSHLEEIIISEEKSTDRKICIQDNNSFESPTCSRHTSSWVNVNEKNQKSIPPNNEVIQAQNTSWRSGNLFNKFNKIIIPYSVNHTNPEDDTKSKTDNSQNDLKSLGRIKINEFYEKVQLNKIRYSLLKPNNRSNKKIMENTSSASLLGDLQKLDDSTSYSGFKKSLKKQSSILDTTSSDVSSSFPNPTDEKTTPDYSNANNEKILQIMNLNTAMSRSDEGIKPEGNKEKHKQSHSLRSSPQKIKMLGAIGRSISEHQATDDDIDDDDDIMHEELQIVDDNDDDDDDDDDDDENLMPPNDLRSRGFVRVKKIVASCPTGEVSSSLPSFFDSENKSLPVSPLFHGKAKSMSREQSLSELPLSACTRRSLMRDSSLQSDSSHCSSVESLLEARKPDPEAILINLGFGPLHSEDILSKIPKRFLKPSQVRGVDTEAFLRQQQLASHLHDHSVLGYRGLVGNPHIPPSMIVAKIMERFEINERQRCIMDINLSRPQSAPPTPGPNQ